LDLPFPRFEDLLGRMKPWICLMLSGLLGFAAEVQVARAQAVGLTNLWKFRLPDEGAKSSPALAPDGTIYQGTFAGWLVALTPDGNRKWQFKAGREIKSSPAVAADGTIYFGSRDRKFYALTPAGKLKWTFATGAWVDSSPAIAADGMVCFGSWDTNFYALNPDGKLKWTYATGDIVDSSPAIAADGTIYFGSHDRNVYALTPDGRLKWKFATGAQITASPTLVADGAIYINSTDGNCYALNPDGTERWRRHTGGSSSSSPVLDENGNLYFAAGTEQCSLTADGKLRWTFPNNNPIPNSGAALAEKFMFLNGPWAHSGLANTDANFLWSFPVGYGFYGSANVSPSGVIYFPDLQYIYAFVPVPNAEPPAKSSWPLWRANPQHTGRVGK
jgi:outer membrane protein assembly factor BamB